MLHSRICDNACYLCRLYNCITSCCPETLLTFCISIKVSFSQAGQSCFICNCFSLPSEISVQLFYRSLLQVPRSSTYTGVSQAVCPGALLHPEREPDASRFNGTAIYQLFSYLKKSFKKARYTSFRV